MFLKVETDSRTVGCVNMDNVACHFHDESGRFIVILNDGTKVTCRKLMGDYSDPEAIHEEMVGEGEALREARSS